MFAASLVFSKKKPYIIPTPWRRRGLNNFHYKPFLISVKISFYHLGDLRAKGKSISRAITSILLLIFLKLFSPLKNAITEYGLFYLFGGVMALLTPLTYFKGPRRADDEPSNWFYMPETKDVPLEDIRYQFAVVMMMMMQRD